MAVLEPSTRRLAALHAALCPPRALAAAAAATPARPLHSLASSAEQRLSTSLRALGARPGAPHCTALGLGGVCWEEDDVAWMANVDAAYVDTGVRYFDTAPACECQPAYVLCCCCCCCHARVTAAATAAAVATATTGDWWPPLTTFCTCL